MNASVILSYAFMYFVLFIAVPFVVVTFVMTCIKFFKSEPLVSESNVKVKAHQLDRNSLDFLQNLKAITKDKYDVIYGTNLGHIIDVDDDLKPEDTVIEYLQQCQLDYVVVDHESSLVKLVIADPKEHTAEQHRFLERALDNIGVRLLDLSENKACDVTQIKNALAA